MLGLAFTVEIINKLLSGIMGTTGTGAGLD